VSKNNSEMKSIYNHKRYSPLSYIIKDAFDYYILKIKYDKSIMELQKGVKYYEIFGVIIK
jgi:hypothetical protein